METLEMPPGDVTIWDGVRHGPQITGSEAPKITTTGRPKAAAMWAGPESLPTKSAACASRFLTSESGAPEMVRYGWKAARSSPGPPINTGVRPDCWRASATARNLSAHQVFSGVAATAWITAHPGMPVNGPAANLALGMSPGGAPR